MNWEELKERYGQRFVLLVVTAITLFLIYVFMFKYSIKAGDRMLEVEKKEFYVKDVVLDGKTVSALYDGWAVSYEEVLVENDNGEIDGEVLLKPIYIHDSLRNTPVLSRMLVQLEKSELLGMKHKKAMLYFYQQNYAFIILQGIMLLLTTALGAIITKAGWENTSKKLLFLFFFLGGCSLFCYNVPDALNYEGNTKTNKRHYLQYKTIAAEIHSYLTTMENAKGSSQAPEKFIHRIDSLIDKNQAVAVDFNNEALMDVMNAAVEGR